MKRWSHCTRSAWHDEQKQRSAKQGDRQDGRPAREATPSHSLSFVAGPKKLPTYLFPRCSSPNIRAVTVTGESHL